MRLKRSHRTLFYENNDKTGSCAVNRRVGKLYNCEKYAYACFSSPFPQWKKFIRTLSLDIYLAQNTWRQLRWKTSYDDSRVQFLQSNWNYVSITILCRLSCNSIASQWTIKANYDPFQRWNKYFLFLFLIFLVSTRTVNRSRWNWNTLEIHIRFAFRKERARARWNKREGISKLKSWITTRLDYGSRCRKSI